MEPRIQYAKTEDGVNIAYWTMGEGESTLVMFPPLMFGHAARELDIPELLRWYERLSAVRRVVRFDMRGMGLSDRGRLETAAGFELDIKAVIDALGLEQVDLFGFDGPAQAAIRFAAAYPNRVSKLVLWAAYTSNRMLNDAPRIAAILSLAERDWDLFTETFAHAWAGWSPQSQAGRWAELIRESMTQRDCLLLLRAVGGLDVSGRLPSIRAETLVLYEPGLWDRVGDRDFGLEESRVVASSIPDARLVQLSETFKPPHVNESGTAAMEEFLGGAVAPTPSTEPPRTDLPSGTAVILFADIADSTALTEQLGDEAFRERARELDGSLRTVIRESGGTPVEGKLLGDGVLAVFTSARQAIKAALRCADAGGHGGLPLHVGLHAGDVIREDDGNVYGGAVNIAARISGESAPGEVLVSGTVRDLARTSAGVSFEDAGERSLKGVSEPVRVWRVVQGEPS